VNFRACPLHLFAAGTQASLPASTTRQLGKKKMRVVWRENSFSLQGLLTQSPGEAGMKKGRGRYHPPAFLDFYQPGWVSVTPPRN
jgi:hypothetical protein